MKPETFVVTHNGKDIQSAGDCPKCQSPVEYIGEGFITIGRIPGLGYKDHKGICVECNTQYRITM